MLLLFLLDNLSRVAQFLNVSGDVRYFNSHIEELYFHHNASSEAAALNKAARIKPHQTSSRPETIKKYNTNSVADEEPLDVPVVAVIWNECLQSVNNRNYLYFFV